jgi:ribosomal protein S18 acetylase RimI-like enzyme
MIREWKLEDTESITTLLNQLSKDLGEEDSYKSDNVKKHFLEMSKNKNTYEAYVYVIKKSIIGFISIIYYNSVFHKVGTALINELVVACDYRKMGIGKELIDFVLKKAKAKKMDEIEVGVMKENIGAITFYKKNGFDEEYLLLGREF